MVIHPGQNECKKAAHSQKNQMPQDMTVGIGTGLHIHVIGRAVYIKSPQDNQYACHDEHLLQCPGRILHINQGRLATRRHTGFPFLENFSSYSVSTSPATGAA